MISLLQGHDHEILPLKDRVYYMSKFMDEYSHYLLHQEVLLGMDGGPCAGEALAGAGSAARCGLP
jgi:hypothetical protein